MRSQSYYGYKITMTKERNNEQVVIIIVDDDDIDAYGILRAMKRLNISNPTLRARDGIEALEILRETSNLEKPFLVLLDLNMPRMDGLELLDTIRADDQLKDTVIFVLTTSNADEDLLRAYRKNIAGYVVKHELKDGYEGLINMLDNYWRVVELPR